MNPFSRRRFLAGLGAGALLTPFVPMLESEAQEGGAPRRIIFLFSANGTIRDLDILRASEHRLLDRANGPLIAVRLSILTRKTLGGLHTTLDSQMIGADGAPLPGLFAVGEAAGFGGGGYHGYNALEGTFLGGCLFSGRQAGRSDQIA